MKDTKFMNTAYVIELNKDEINEAIESSGVYKEDGVATIKNWEGDSESDFYLASFTKNSFSYKGLVNKKLNRENYGVNSYDNDDIYFGMFENDKKSQHGAYLFKPELKSGFVNSEMYHGYWKNDQKDVRGVYIWLREKKGKEDLENAEMEAYIGEIEYESFKRGCYLSKSGDKHHLYYGNIERDGKKNDENAYFYDYYHDRVFFGKISNDKFVSGFFAVYDKISGDFKNLISVEFDKNDAVVKFSKELEIDGENKNKIIQNVNFFRNTITSENTFDNLYEHFKDVQGFINKDIKDMNAFDSEDLYPKMMKVGSSYNSFEIYSKLEKYFKNL